MSVRTIALLALALLFALSGCTRSASDAPTTPDELSEELQALRARLAEPTENVQATVVAGIAGTQTAEPTKASVSTAIAIPVTESPAKLPEYDDVPWFFQGEVRYAVENELLKPVNETTFGSNLEEVFAWQVYCGSRKIRFGDEGLPKPVWKFLDLDPASEQTKLDDETVKIVASCVEDLLSRGLVFGCDLRNNPPGVCPERRARANTIAILATVLELELPDAEELKNNENFPKDLSLASVYAPYVMAFMDMGCLEPGTNPPEFVHPFQPTTKLQLAIWYVCYSQNLPTEN